MLAHIETGFLRASQFTAAPSQGTNERHRSTVRWNREDGVDSALHVCIAVARRELLLFSLSNFARLWLDQVGAHFVRERKIWGAGPLQYFSFPPPEEERSQRA
jgi:hypothetical protein